MATLLAQAGGGGPDLISNLVGVLSETILGVVVILMILGYLWAKPAVDAIRDDNVRLNKVVERKDEELASLRKSIEENVIPSIEKNAHVADRVVGLLEENKDTARRLGEVLDRIDGPR